MKNNSFIIYLFITALCLSISGCEKNLESTSEQKDIVLELSADEILSGPEGGKFEINVSSNEDWRIAGKSDWVRPDKWHGSNGEVVVFTVDANIDKHEKEAEFKFFSGNRTVVVCVKSYPEYFLLTDSEEDIQVSSDGGPIVVKVNTNIPDLSCSIEGDTGGWITLDYQGEAFGMRIFEFSTSKSESFTERSASISLAGEGKKIDFNVIQAQKDTIEAKPLVVEGISSVEVEFVVYSNVDFALDTPDWITIIDTDIIGLDDRGLSITKYTLGVSETENSRKGNLALSSDGINQNIEIRQVNTEADLITISDINFMKALDDKGWVFIHSMENCQCEILPSGRTNTKMLLNGNHSKTYDIRSIKGIENFPQITEINLSYNMNLKEVDISSLKNVTKLFLSNVSAAEFVNVGDNRIIQISIGVFSSMTSESLRVIGSKVEKIMSSDTMMDTLASLDVTGCPSLKEVNCNRPAMRYLYLTEEQAKPGVLKITKNSVTEIVIR